VCVCVCVCASHCDSQLEPLLFSLDRTVRSCQGDSLHSTTGYLEAVVDILGIDCALRHVTMLAIMLCVCGNIADCL
jgi:hypothetical protein